MASLFDLLSTMPSAGDKLMGLLPLLQSLMAPPPGTSSGTGTTVGYGTTTPSEVPYTTQEPSPGMSQLMAHDPEVNYRPPIAQPVVHGPGDPGYAYSEWDMPYYGEPNNLVTRKGVTLQPAPMQSLIDIARSSEILPGIQEIGEIGGGFRSQAGQRSAYATNPYAAAPGGSYHPMGLAIDAGWWSSHPELAEKLRSSGWNLPMPGYEDWHWSYGVSG